MPLHHSIINHCVVVLNIYRVSCFVFMPTIFLRFARFRSCWFILAILLTNLAVSLIDLAVCSYHHSISHIVHCAVHQLLISQSVLLVLSLQPCCLSPSLHCLSTFRSFFQTSRYLILWLHRLSVVHLVVYLVVARHRSHVVLLASLLSRKSVSISCSFRRQPLSIVQHTLCVVTISLFIMLVFSL